MHASPDGKYVVFESGAISGTCFKIKLLSLQGGGSRFAPPNPGNRRYLYRVFRRAPGAGKCRTAAVTLRGTALEFGVPVKLFDATFLNSNYAMSGDGQRCYGTVDGQEAGESVAACAKSRSKGSMKGL
jgi:hypothetical protein